MPKSQSRSSSEDHSMLASLWPICSIPYCQRAANYRLVLSRCSSLCRMPVGCASSRVRHFHILNFMDFILFHLKFINFKPEIKFTKFELHNCGYKATCVEFDGLCSASERVVSNDVVGTERAQISQLEAQRRLQQTVTTVLYIGRLLTKSNILGKQLRCQYQ